MFTFSFKVDFFNDALFLFNQYYWRLVKFLRPFKEQILDLLIPTVIYLYVKSLISALNIISPCVG